MITPFVATWIVRVAGAYLFLGLLFAVPFAFRWVGRTDPVARQGTGGFRLLLIPGAMALWPLLLRRLLQGQTLPPMERNAHRSRAR